MFRFENPHFLYLLAIIPLMAAIHYFTNYMRSKRLRAYGDPDLLRALMPDVSPMRRELKSWLLLFALAMLIVALARPQYGTKTDTRKRKGIEAIIAMDVSNSMMAQDVTPNRLERSKMLVSNIVDKMTDDKIGLIVYAGEAFTQLPITSDYVSAKMFLETLSPEMVTTQGTDIKQAIDLAMKSFTPNQEVSKAIFVITDGEDNEGGAVEAAEDAAEQGIKVYVLGVGQPQGAPIPQPKQNGAYITDNEGNVVISKLNEAMCKQIAAAGKGAYIYVDNSSSAQQRLSEHVDKLAKKDIETILYSEYDEQFQAVAILALLALIMDILINECKNPRLKNISLFKRNDTHEK